ncbi:hypothetical protein P5673_013141 [Acropora cervicornis]|uniref:Uncharacterized protein n=1 Tax=Acropora cervicornis TaxID=6130 RepID=A0AAD9QLE8_ACRCE|nr:hypothetical protein P5673_013141 [Acropora cervicornis]
MTDRARSSKSFLQSSKEQSLGSLALVLAKAITSAEYVFSVKTKPEPLLSLTWSMDGIFCATVITQENTRAVNDKGISTFPWWTCRCIGKHDMYGHHYCLQYNNLKLGNKYLPQTVKLKSIPKNRHLKVENVAPE